MAIAMAFGLVALFLASIGVYGLLACQVTERRREIGIRMALGSSAADVFGLVMRDGARITVLGILVGLAGTVGTTRLMTGRCTASRRRILSSSAPSHSCSRPWHSSRRGCRRAAPRE